MRLRLGRPRVALVVAPHPDDEVIGAFGLLRALRARGVRVRVLVVTDGAASHPGSARWPRARLTLQRRRESRWALRRLGLAAGAVRSLGLPDGGLEREPAALAHALGREVRRAAGLALLVGPAPDDDHADHRAVAVALARTPTRARRLAYPVWPAGAFARNVRTLPVPGGVAAKRSALRVYRTQMGAITDDPQGFALSAAQVAAFTRGVERFVELRA